MRELTEKQKEANEKRRKQMEEKWKDKAYRERMIKVQKRLGYRLDCAI